MHTFEIGVVSAMYGLSLLHGIHGNDTKLQVAAVWIKNVNLGMEAEGVQS